MYIRLNTAVNTQAAKRLSFINQPTKERCSRKEFRVLCVSECVCVKTCVVCVSLDTTGNEERKEFLFEENKSIALSYRL